MDSGLDAFAHVKSLMSNMREVYPINQATDTLAQKFLEQKSGALNALRFPASIFFMAAASVL